MRIDKSYRITDKGKEEFQRVSAKSEGIPSNELLFMQHFNNFSTVTIKDLIENFSTFYSPNVLELLVKFYECGHIEEVN